MAGRRDLLGEVAYGLALAVALSLVVLAVLLTAGRVRFLPAPSSNALLAAVPADASQIHPGDLVAFLDPDPGRSGLITQRVAAVAPHEVRTTDWVLDPDGSTFYLVKSVIPGGADPVVWFVVALAVPPFALLVVAVLLGVGSRRRQTAEDPPLAIMTPRESNRPDTADSLHG